MNRRGILYRILGETLDGLSDGEMSVAESVLDYFMPKCCAVRYDDESVLAACKYAVSAVGEDWDNVMLSKCRSRRLVEMRYCIFHIFFHRTSCKQSVKTEMLGGVFDRTSILYGIKIADCLRVSNKDFASRYATFAQLVEDYLFTEYDKGRITEGDH